MLFTTSRVAEMKGNPSSWTMLTMSSFKHILIESLTIYRVKLYSYVLMKNHFHLPVGTP